MEIVDDYRQADECVVFFRRIEPDGEEEGF
jgi:hypothetical protein